MMQRSALALAVLMVSSAAAQGVVSVPRWTVGVESDATDPNTPLLEAGGSASVEVTVQASLADVLCQGEVAATLALALHHNGPPGLTVTLPDSVEIRLPSNLAAAGTGTGIGHATVTLSVVAAMDAPPRDYLYTLTVTAPSVIPDGCVGVQPPPEERVVLNLHLRTGPTTSNATAPDSSGAASSAARGASSLPAVGLLGALAVAVRRRSR